MFSGNPFPDEISSKCLNDGKAFRKRDILMPESRGKQALQIDTGAGTERTNRMLLNIVADAVKVRWRQQITDLQSICMRSFDNIFIYCRQNQAGL